MPWSVSGAWSSSWKIDRREKSLSRRAQSNLNLSTVHKNNSKMFILSHKKYHHMKPFGCSVKKVNQIFSNLRFISHSRITLNFSSKESGRCVDARLTLQQPESKNPHLLTLCQVILVTNYWLFIACCKILIIGLMPKLKY